MKKLNKKGFTIVELVIVIAVIAILAAVLIPTFSSVIANANKSSALQESKTALTNVTMSEQLRTDGGDLAKKNVYFVGSKYVCVCKAGGKMDADATTDIKTDIATTAKLILAAANNGVASGSETTIVYTKAAQTDAQKTAMGAAKSFLTNEDIPEGMTVIISDVAVDLAETLK